MKVFVCICLFLLIGVFGCSKDNTSRLTAMDAVNNALSKAGEGWLLANLSNTGVIKNQASSINNFKQLKECLMNKQGMAGQWIVELCRDIMFTKEEGGKTEQYYPYIVYLCTTKSTIEITGGGIISPNKPSLLKMEYIKSLDKARELAIKNWNKKYDCLSVASYIQPNNDIMIWRFKFYNFKDEILDEILITGDGSQVVKYK